MSNPEGYNENPEHLENPSSIHEGIEDKDQPEEVKLTHDWEAGEDINDPKGKENTFVRGQLKSKIPRPAIRNRKSYSELLSKISK